MQKKPVLYQTVRARREQRAQQGPEEFSIASDGARSLEMRASSTGHVEDARKKANLEAGAYRMSSRTRCPTEP